MDQRNVFILVDQAVAMVAAPSSDVAEDDQATRVTYGVINLTHRHGHGEPQPLEPGITTTVLDPVHHNRLVHRVFSRNYRRPMPRDPV